MSLYQLCLQDGRFLVKFYICHPADSWYNAVNQWFWLQYHMDSKLQSPLSTMETHLIRLSATLVDYATHHKLSAFQNGWTWHITTLSFTAPLNSPLSMAAKHKIVSHKQTGIPQIILQHVPLPVTRFRYSVLFNPCWPRSPCANSRYSNCPSTNLDSIPHFWYIRLASSTLTKGLGVDCIPSPVLYIHSNLKVLFWGATHWDGYITMCLSVYIVHSAGELVMC